MLQERQQSATKRVEDYIAQKKAKEKQKENNAKLQKMMYSCGRDELTADRQTAATSAGKK